MTLVNHDIHDIHGVILAGGQGQRMNSQDKGLLLLCHQPLVYWTIKRLQQQVKSIVINANRFLEDYKKLNYPVVSDSITGFLGPLAGIHAGLLATQANEWTVFVPCDSPFFPNNLVKRLYQQALIQEADIAVASVNGYPQPVFLIARTSLASGLAHFITQEQKIMLWCRQHKWITVEFSDARCFDNINTPEDLQAAHITIQEEWKNG